MKFTKTNKTIKYKNPYKSSNATKPFFIINNAEVFNYKNGTIIKIHDKRFDYLVNEELVTQRLGASEELLKLLIEYNVKAGDYHLMFKITNGDLKLKNCKVQVQGSLF